jgi:hypothetical protein
VSIIFQRLASIAAMRQTPRAVPIATLSQPLASSPARHRHFSALLVKTCHRHSCHGMPCFLCVFFSFFFFLLVLSRLRYFIRVSVWLITIFLSQRASGAVRYEMFQQTHCSLVPLDRKYLDTEVSTCSPLPFSIGPDTQMQSIARNNWAMTVLQWPYYASLRL